MSTPEQIFQTAINLRKAGFDVIPVHPTKKYPMGIDGWETEQFSDEELKQKIIGEKWSLSLRNKECFDFDTNHGMFNVDEKFAVWEQLVEKEKPGLLKKAVIEKTQHNGYHVWLNCQLSQGASKLAYRHPTEEERKAEPNKDKYCLIETRIQNTLITPSYGYELISGDFLNMEEITPEEREVFLRCATIFDEFPKPTTINVAVHIENDGDAPWDIYNARCGSEPFELLLQAGWRGIYQRNDVVYLCRPGKTHGISATFGHVGPGVLYNFSSNASPFEAGRSYNQFQIFTLLNHDGDYSAATRAVSERWPFEKELPIKSDGSLDIGTPGTLTSEAGKANAERPRRLRLIDKVIKLAELNEEEYKYDWVWEDYIAKRNITLLSALMKAGKSTFFRAFLKALINGEEFLGHSTQKINILIISEEDKTIWQDKREEFELYSDNIFLLSKPYPKPKEEEWKRYIDETIEVCTLNKIELIIIDTVSKFLPISKENDPSQWEYSLTHTNALLDMNIAILLVHHNNKGEGEHGVEVRGSTALAAYVDQLIILKRPKGNAKMNQRIITLEGRLTPPKEVMIEYDNDTQKYTALGAPHEISKEGRHEHILLIVERQIEVTIQGIIANWDYGRTQAPPRRSIERDIKHLCDTGRLKISKKEKYNKGYTIYYKLGDGILSLGTPEDEDNETYEKDQSTESTPMSLASANSNSEPSNRQLQLAHSDSQSVDASTNNEKDLANMPIESANSELQKSNWQTPNTFKGEMPIENSEKSHIPKTITYANGKTAVVEEAGGIGLPEKDKKGNYILPGIKT